MTYTIQKHVQYNLWANGKVAEFILKTDEANFDREVRSSFSSLRETIYHIWDAEVIWLARIQGKLPHDWPSKHFKGNRDAVLEAFLYNSNHLAEFMLNKQSGFEQSLITYHNLKGHEFVNTIEEIVMHVVNHGSFHRGQIVTMLRTLGFTELSSSDLITYLRQ